MRWDAFEQNVIYMYIQKFYSPTRMRTVTNERDTLIPICYTTNNHKMSYIIFKPYNTLQNGVIEIRVCPSASKAILKNIDKSDESTDNYVINTTKLRNPKTVCLFNGMFTIHIPNTSLTNMLWLIAGHWYVITRIVFCWISWSNGMDELFHPTVLRGCNYWSMPSF